METKDLLVELHDEYTLVQKGGNTLSLSGPDRSRSIQCRSAGVYDAMLEIDDGTSTREELKQFVRGPVTDGTLVELLQLMRHLEQIGAIQYSLSTDDRTLAVLKPMSRSFQYATPEITTADTCRISRFTCMRRMDDSFIAENPRGHGYVKLVKPETVQLLHMLSRSRNVSDIVTGVDSFSAPYLGALLQMFLSTEIIDRDEPPEDERTWEFHDLYFHARSRDPRHYGGDGATFRFGDSIDPPPHLDPPGAEDTISLPKPKLDKLKQEDPSFTDVMESRRSIRTYSETPPTKKEIGEFLYRSARIKNVDNSGEYTTTTRVYPGAGALYEFEIYPVINDATNLENGLYYYHPGNHQLLRQSGMTSPVKNLVKRARISTGDQLTPDVQVLFLIGARFRRMSWKYETVAYSLTLKNLGVLYQTFYLTASVMNLAPCALGTGDSDLFCQATGTDYLRQNSVGEFLLGRPAHESN